jgi:PKD repeat protein
MFRRINHIIHNKSNIIVVLTIFVTTAAFVFGVSTRSSNAAGEEAPVSDVVSFFQFSLLPTNTPTPFPPTPTDTSTPTPLPPTPTDTATPTPFPPTPTDTPLPPTDTPVPNIPPELGPILIVPLDGIAQINTTINVSAVFTDTPLIDSHDAVWDWGDGSADGCPTDSVVCTVDQDNDQVVGSHEYNAPGVYTVNLTLSDSYAASDTATYEFVIIYDPSGGFVTGGGWIFSPTGAYKPDPSLVGLANFGFVSKYKTGAIVPTGKTQFQFKAADLKYFSDNYQWLVVTGNSSARFKGSGTINGELASNGDPYQFMIWAGDGLLDWLRIKIWWEDDDQNEVVVYDNGFNQAIGGGSIVVHNGK